MAERGRNESDRLQKSGFIQSMTRHPEIGAAMVMIVILLVLGMASGGLFGGNPWNPLDGTAYNPLGIRNNTRIVAQLGIIAIGACLLMIAGEFDLSIGSMIGFAGMSMAMMLKWGLPFGLGEATPFLAFAITLAMTLGWGWLIGTIVVRSGLSSFIVSLAFLFFLRGLTEVSFRLINQSTQISGLEDFKETSLFARAFGGESFGWLYDLAFQLGFNLNRRGEQWVTGLDARMVWWIVIGLFAYVVLSRTQLGNWIFATGDNKDSARANGVPVDRVKIGLFMFTAFCATIFAACQVFDTNTADAAKGNLKELEAIAIAVVGGTLMTGGFGSVIGVAFGAVTFGLVANAVFYIPWIDGSFYRVFVGVVLLAAVFANERIRKRITGGI